MGVRWIHYLKKEECEAKLIFCGQSCEGKVVELRKRLVEISHQATGELKEQFAKWETEFLAKVSGAAGGDEFVDNTDEFETPALQSTINPGTITTTEPTTTTATFSFTTAGITTFVDTTGNNTFSNLNQLSYRGENTQTYTTSGANTHLRWCIPTNVGTSGKNEGGNPPHYMISTENSKGTVLHSLDKWLFPKFIFSYFQ